MHKMFKKMRNKWLSFLIIGSMIFQNIPLSIAFAEDNNDSQMKIQPEIQLEKNTKKEVLSKRTENSRTYENSDGTFTTEISPSPMHFRSSNNEWKQIDNDLLTNSKEKTIENKANAFHVQFPQEYTKNKSLFHLSEQNRSVDLELMPLEHTGQMPADSKGTSKGSSVTYANIFPNMNLVYSIGSDRIKEDIIYTNQPAEGFPKQFIYKMTLNGMTAKKENGTIYLYAEDSKEPLYYFDTPYMYDAYIPDGFVASSIGSSIPEEAMSFDVQLDYKIIEDALYLYVIPNKEWLESTQRVYPITIDPTIVRLQSAAYVEDTSIRSALPTQTGGNDLELGAGTSSGNTIRSLIKFDVSSIPDHSTILSSSLDAWFSSTNGSTSMSASIYKVTKSWVENQASWTYTKTVPSTTWTTAGGDYEATKLATVAGLTTPTSLDNDIKKWEIPVSIVQGWKDSPTTNYGLLMKSDSEATNVYKKFISSENSVDSKYHPLLVVTYRTNARLGLEDYWLYDKHPLVGGASFSNLTTDNNVVQFSDFYMPGRGGFDFLFTRTYNSKSKESSAMGYGWTYKGNEKIYINIKNTANILNYQDEDGTDHEFTYDGPTATYYSGPGKYMTIVKSVTDPSIYTLQDKYGYKTTFKILQSSSDTNVKVAYIQTEEDLHGNTIQYVYDTSNRLIKITNSIGNGITFTYNIVGYISKISYENIQFAFTYDGSGRVTNVVQTKDASTTSETKFNYTDGLLSTITDPTGRKTDFTYVNGYLSSVQEPDNQSEMDAANRPGTSYSLDIATKKATVTDPLGNVTTYYTNDNFVPVSMHAGGIDTYYMLDSNYNVLKETVDGSETINTYDTKGNLLTTKDALLNTQSYTYTTYGSVKTHTDSNQKTTTNTYNSKEDLVKVEVQDSNVVGGKLVTNYTYDNYGDLQTITFPDTSSQTISMDYTTSVKTIQQTDAFGNTTIFKQDLKGNVIESENGKKDRYGYSFNSKNELINVTDPKLGQTVYSYDAKGNVTSIKNAKNALSTYVYNGQNQLSSEKTALQQTTNYSYDQNGNLVDVNLPSGDVIHRTYDALNRETEVAINGNVQWKRVFNGVHLSAVYKGTALAKTLTFNSNHLLQSIQEGSNTLSYSYLGNDAISQVSYTVDGNSTQLNYVLDDVYRVKELKRNNVTLASFQYNQAGLPTAVVYANGSSLGMTYDRNRLSTYTMKRTVTDIADTYSLEYDANQQIQRIVSNAGTTSYVYDELNQLTSETLPDGTTISYVYDAVGNRTQKATTTTNGTTTVNYTYNAANQLTTVGNENYVYDVNGNVTSDGVHTFEFNGFQQLVAVKNNAGETIATYSYDENGKRKSTTVAGETVYYYYDGDNVLYETNENNTMIRSYTYNEIGHPLTMTTNNQTYYYLTNYHGDVIGLTDLGGNIVASYSYDAWGNILTQSGALAEANPYRYASYRYDEQTKLYYLMARYYNPNNGVFLSVDPYRGDMDRPLSLNGYTYASNNPVNFIDPDGMKEVNTGIGGPPASVPYNRWNEVGKGTGNAPQKAIGHYPEYVALSNKLNVKPFSIPEKVWNKMTPSEQWAANRKFLDRAIAKNSEFNLATPINKVRPGSYLEKEIKYLMSKGYKLSKDGTKLVK